MTQFGKWFIAEEPAPSTGEMERRAKISFCAFRKLHPNAVGMRIIVKIGDPTDPYNDKTTYGWKCHVP